MWLTYSRKLVKLPRPHFVVFYNGTESTPDHEVMKLSDAFEGEGNPLTLELVADVYNINAGHNSALLEACTTLKGYADFVRRTRENQRTMAFSQAINKAVDDCIHDGILADFLKACKTEVVGVSIFEFDREEYEKIILAEEHEDGREEGAYNTKIATARNMIRMGFSREQIAQATELPLIEVAAL